MEVKPRRRGDWQARRYRTLFATARVRRSQRLIHQTKFDQGTAAIGLGSIRNAVEARIAIDAGAQCFSGSQLGPAYIRVVLAPMPYLRLMPTGGVDLTNINQYLAAGAVAVGVGGQFVDPSWIRNCQWDAVTKAASEYMLAANSCP